MDYGRIKFVVRRGVKPRGKNNYPVWVYVDGGVLEPHGPDEWYFDRKVLPYLIWPISAFDTILAA